MEFYIPFMYIQLPIILSYVKSLQQIRLSFAQIFAQWYTVKAKEFRALTRPCPKNQNKCWYKTGSPPPAGSKNDVLKLRSVNNIVIAPAKTGKDNNNKNAVINTDHTNKGNRYNVNPGNRILKIVVIKLTAPKIEEAPDKCNEKIAISTEGPECA